MTPRRLLVLTLTCAAAAAGVLVSAYAVIAVNSPIVFGTPSEKAMAADVIRFIEDHGGRFPATIVRFECPWATDIHGRTIPTGYIRPIYMVFACDGTEETLAHELGHAIVESAPQQSRDAVVESWPGVDSWWWLSEMPPEDIAVSYRRGEIYGTARFFLHP